MPSNDLTDAIDAAEDASHDQPDDGADLPKQYRGITELLQDTEAWQRQHLWDAIRPGTDRDRFMAAALTAVRQNPNLRELGATAEGRRSIMFALTRCASLGLEPNNELGHAYLIAFKRNRDTPRERMELQLIVGYKGYLKLAAESGNLKEIDVHEVHEKDDFKVVYGTSPDAGIRHEPFLKPGDPGDIYCYYIVVKFHDGGSYATHMRLEDIDERKNRSGAVKAGVSTPWDTDPVSMSKKTLVRAAVPYMRLDARTVEALDMDEKVVHLSEDGESFEYLETTGAETGELVGASAGPPSVDGPTS